MTLIQSLAEIFTEEATAVFKRESEDASYLKQNWLGTTWRAFKGLLEIYKKAFPRQLKVLTYAIAKHRLEDPKHMDEKQQTVIDRVSRSMSTDDLEKASNESEWWNN